MDEQLINAINLNTTTLDTIRVAINTLTFTIVVFATMGTWRYRPRRKHG